MERRVIQALVCIFIISLDSTSSCFVESSRMRYNRVGPTEVAEEVEGQENDEKRLLRYLMRGYERDVRPVKNASTPIVIHLSITLTQIFDMDEKNQVLTTIIWLDQEWKDELLTWNPDDFGGIKTLRMPCERIWVPDIVLYNNADDYTRGYMNSKAMVGHDGNVFWPPPTKLRSTCPVDVTYFPFDDQLCVLKLGSWTYDGFQVDVTNRTSEVDLTNYVQSGEWELLEAQLVRNVVYYSCCPEPFPDVTVTLRIRRKTLYYIYNIVLPCMMLSVLTLLVFCLPPESGEKIALGITVLLAFSVFMLAIAEKMPETSESIPLIGIYLTAVMAITSISVVMTVVVLNCHYKGPSSKPVPQWLKSLLGCASKICCRSPFASSSAAAETCVYHAIHDPAVSNGKLTTREYHLEQSQSEHADAPYSVSTIPTSPPQTAFRRLNENQSQNIINMNINNQKQDVTSVGNTDVAGSNLNRGSICSSCRNGSFHVDASGPHHQQQQQQQEQQDTLVHYFLDQKKIMETNQAIVDQWRQVAILVDRVLFWVFCIVTCISSALFLLIIPGYKRSWFAAS